MGRKKGKKSGEQKEEQAPEGPPKGPAPGPSQPQQPPQQQPQQPPQQQVEAGAAAGGGDVAGSQQSKKKKKQKQQQEPQFTEPEPPPSKQQPKKKKEQTPPQVTESEKVEPPPQQQVRKKQPQEQLPPPHLTQREEIEQSPPPQLQQPKKRQPAGRGFGRGQERVQTEVRPGPSEPQIGIPPGFPSWGQKKGPPEMKAPQPQEMRFPPELGGARGAVPPQMAPPSRLPPQTAPPPRLEAPRGPSPPQTGPPPRFQGPRGPSPPQVGPPPGFKGPRGPSPRQTTPPSGAEKPAIAGPHVGAGDSVESITKGIKLLKFTPPLRKDSKKGGTQGKRIMVETNHLRLDLSKVKRNIVIHYDVTLEPNLPKRLLRFAMEEFRRRHYPNRFPAFDGKKNLYSSGELPFGGEIADEVQVHDDESMREKTFKISVKFAAQVDLQTLVTYMSSGQSSLDRPQKAIQALDVVLRSAPAFRFVQVGRSFFTPPRDQIYSLGDGLELWHGFYQSAILGWKPFVNVDVAHKGFPTSQNVVDAILDICQLRNEDLRNNLPYRAQEEFQKYIRGLKIEYELPNVPGSRRTYKVNRLVESATTLRFTLDDGRSITVEQYFTREKNYRLQYPNIPCLHVGSLNRPKPIYLPAELCTIVRGQVTNKKMNEIQTSNMIKQAATNTDVRKRKIMDALKQVRFNDDPCVREFGLSVSDKFETVEARILNPPMLEYKQGGNQSTVMPQKGVWRASAFITGMRLNSWIILNLNRYTRDDELRRFADDMKRMGQSLGMNIDPPLPPRHMQYRRIQELVEFFSSIKKEVQLVVVVVPDRGNTYAHVKQAAELSVGVLTQCIRARTMQRINPATCSNILLKVNSKLNGVNHSLASQSRPLCLRRPVMIVGADVTHPSPDQTDIPSVAAVTASHDPKAYQYNIQFRLQPPRVEIIEDLQNIIKHQLKFFFNKTNGLKPERILFFRDGVSEGQFAQVISHELMAIRRACASFGSEYKPKVTFLVVQKRHHTRFFPTSDRDADGKNRNVPAGTVVDTEITHPTEIDFYLASHASIQGVTRPTKYHVLWDDDNMSEDEIEALTYYLCHMFARCTRSVSYPTPTYYAHLAAFRARVYLEGKTVNLTNLARQEQELLTVMQDIIAGYPMYFV